MEFTDPRAAEARRLREEEGMSTPEIRARLRVGNNKLFEWLRGTKPPEWTARPNAKDDVQEAARALRREGKSYNQIVAELGVSKSSVSLWVRDIPYVPDPRQGWTEEAREKREETKRWRRERKVAEQERRRAAAADDLGELGHDALQVAGSIAYWCEGAKWKAWHSGPPAVQFINSDPGLLRLFIRFVESAPVSHGGLKFRLHIHENGDELATQSFWADELGISVDDFAPTVWKRHNPKTVRKNVGEGYHGCVLIYVYQSAELYWYIDALASAIMRSMVGPEHPTREAG